jgi:hypothetical protein
MAYIPTIHTFEDDINENRGFDAQQVGSGIETITPRESILIAEKSKTSTIKIFLIFLSVIFFLGAIGIVGYYYYNNYQKKQAELALNIKAQALVEERRAREEASIINNLNSIFPSIASGMSQYISSVIKKENIIIITIKANDMNEVDNYSQLYTYIFAHQKDLGKDLVNTFNLNNVVDEASTSNELLVMPSTSSSTEATSTKKTSTSSNLANVVNLFDPASLQENFSTLMTNVTTPTTISGDSLIWESKTLNNQDFQITNAGVVTLIYGYVRQNYLVFSVSLKDFFDTVKSLK